MNRLPKTKTVRIELIGAKKVESDIRRIKKGIESLQISLNKLTLKVKKDGNKR